MTPEQLRYMGYAVEKRGSVLSQLANPNTFRKLMRPGVVTGLRHATRTPAGSAASGAAMGSAANIGREAASDREDKNYLAAGLQGGLFGAAAGGAAGRARDISLMTGKRGIGLATEFGKQTGSGVKNFGLRQLHGATGYVPKQGLGRIGVAGKTTARREAMLKSRRASQRARDLPEADQKKLMDRTNQEVRDILRRGRHDQEMQDLGLTSIPGVARGLFRNPKDTSKAVWRHNVGKGGPGGVAMGVGLPAAVSAPDLMRGDESDRGGRGMGQKLMSAGGLVAGSMLTSGIPIVPQAAAVTGIDVGSAQVGKQFDKLRKR